MPRRASSLPTTCNVVPEQPFVSPRSMTATARRTVVGSRPISAAISVTTAAGTRAGVRALRVLMGLHRAHRIPACDGGAVPLSFWWLAPAVDRCAGRFEPSIAGPSRKVRRCDGLSVRRRSLAPPWHGHRVGFRAWGQRSAGGATECGRPCGECRADAGRRGRGRLPGVGPSRRRLVTVTSRLRAKEPFPPVPTCSQERPERVVPGSVPPVPTP